ncbi:MAG: hypothetical protein IPK81_11670 [Rhodospirillales bacterium]|nr:MAG: hypothetical protein IPK81_11670 [Rhodospirillales bacterium]
MRISIDGLTEAELIDLNNRVVERLKLFSQARAHVAMTAFKIGDRVAFETRDAAVVVGMLTRHNKKSVTVVSDAGQTWNVGPGLLRLAGDKASTSGAAVIIENETSE